MEEVIEKLSDYVLSLSSALEDTVNANERPQITKHLAAASLIFALLQKHQKVSAIERLVKDEIRSHGLSYISGSAGERIATNWVAFTKVVGIEQ